MRLQLMLLLASCLANEAAAAARLRLAGGRCCKLSAGCVHPQGCDDAEAEPFCAASKQNCEGKCKHVWCPSGAGEPGNFTVNASRVVHTVAEHYVSFTFDLSAWSVFARYNNFSDPARHWQQR